MDDLKASFLQGEEDLVSVARWRQSPRSEEAIVTMAVELQWLHTGIRQAFARHVVSMSLQPRLIPIFLGFHKHPSKYYFPLENSEPKHTIWLLPRPCKYNLLQFGLYNWQKYSLLRMMYIVHWWHTYCQPLVLLYKKKIGSMVYPLPHCLSSSVSSL